jgi:hypothetical protein
MAAHPRITRPPTVQRQRPGPCRACRSLRCDPLAGAPSRGIERVHSAPRPLRIRNDVAVTPNVAHPQPLYRFGEIVGRRQLRDTLTTQPAEKLSYLGRTYELHIHPSESRRMPSRHLPIRHVPTKLGICLATDYERRTT